MLVDTSPFQFAKKESAKWGTYEMNDKVVKLEILVGQFTDNHHNQ
jgi:hypothetical protein